MKRVKGVIASAAVAFLLLTGCAGKETGKFVSEEVYGGFEIMDNGKAKIYTLTKNLDIVPEETEEAEWTKTGDRIEFKTSGGVVLTGEFSKDKEELKLYSDKTEKNIVFKRTKEFKKKQ